MTNGQRVLVVDGLAETEEVLKAVLEPQGLEVNRIRTHLSHTTQPARPPHLVILHQDQAEKSARVSDSWPDVPRVIIGAVNFEGDQAKFKGVASSREQHLPQPFHYRDLIQAVELLLSED